MEPKKYFLGNLDITCGEYEFNYHYFITAKTRSQAEKIMKDHAKEFYACRDKPTMCGDFSFNGGEVAVTYYVGDYGTMEELMENHSEFFLKKI